MTVLAEQPRSAEPWLAGRAGAVRARYLANCLRELDGFLHVLLDATAPALTVPAEPRQHNAANKIGALLVGGDVVPQQDRLRALGRTRACLWHCHGQVRRADQRAGEWMTAGWQRAGSGVLQRYRLGERLAPARDELADVADFYRLLAERLIALEDRSR